MDRVGEIRIIDIQENWLRHSSHKNGTVKIQSWVWLMGKEEEEDYYNLQIILRQKNGMIRQNGNLKKKK